MHSSNSLYFVRFTHAINEILTAPFSYIEMIIGFVAGGVVRALIVGFGVLIIEQSSPMPRMIFFDAFCPVNIFLICSISLNSFISGYSHCRQSYNTKDFKVSLTYEQAAAFLDIIFKSRQPLR